MMMKMLDAGGIPVVIDGIRGADRDNPKGYYEFERVKQLDKGDTAWVADAQGKAVKVISALLQHLPADQEYRIIFMERNIDEVLASQRKMMQNRGEGGKDAGGGEDVPDAEMAALFARHVEQVEAWMAQQPNVQVLHIDYNALLADPAPFVARLHDFLPFALDTAAMTAVVDPDLYRNRRR
ncbi:MAG: sulfotransferase [Caldilineaceae bacterium]|nr:sulfotransferase [Caldilineaceae bacterium]